jgi:SOS response regulatory protein OraA/RecX
VLLIIVITVAVSKTICRVQKNRLEDSLKRELVDRGFSVEEIERIVQASAGKTARRSAT